MLTLHYRGALTARTAIAHGGDDRGIIHTFRHEHLILGGRPALVPVISGGAIRGSLRRTSAAMFQAALVGPEGRLPFPVVHALRTGGALTETRDHSEVLTGERQAMLRDLVPHFALFGVSGGGRIMSGRLHVGKALPVTVETAEYAADYGIALDPASLPRLAAVLSEEKHARVADVLSASAQPFIEQNDDGPRSPLPKGAGMLQWTQQTLVRGTRLFHDVVAEDVTPLEAVYVDAVLATWLTRAVVGSNKARGFGRVTGDYTVTVTDILGHNRDLPALDWRDHIETHRAAIIATMKQVWPK